MLMAPSMVGSKLLLADNVEIPIEILLRGIAKEDAKYARDDGSARRRAGRYKARCCSHLRPQFLRKQRPEITAEQVAKVRKEQEGKTEMLKRADLEAMLTPKEGDAEAPAAE